jgi:Ca2+-binding RTX toxin-like protein
MVMLGGDGDDRMTGSIDIGNYFDGGTGNDVMTGGHGGDYMSDGAGGDDIMYGGGGDDQMGDIYGATELYGEDGNDAMTAAGGGGLLDGGAGNDRMWVANGDYTLLGGAGDDTLEFAGFGSTSYTGGAGADVFHYRAGHVGHFTVTDFEDGVDHIFLWDYHYNGNVPLESLNIADSADGAVISWNGPSQMVLTGVQASQLTQDDFLI